MTGTRPALGLTLIELLAVIVIMSLVAGLATVGLAASSESARVHAAAAQWRDLDARARLFAQSLGPVVMSVDQRRAVVTLHAVETNELLSELMLPETVSAGIDAETESILFDRLGRSVDYTVEMRAGDRAVRWRVYGLTGLTVETDQ